MKKILMTVAVVACMMAMSACGNKAAQAEAPAPEEVPALEAQAAQPGEAPACCQGKDSTCCQGKEGGCCQQGAPAPEGEKPACCQEKAE